MTKSATREAADKVTFTQAEVTSAVALKAPIASPSVYRQRGCWCNARGLVFK